MRADVAFPVVVIARGHRAATERGRPKGADAAMIDERLYIVAYDIGNPRRWRRVFRLMKGYGRWLQLSVFQCRLTARRRAEMGRRLDEAIHTGEDHVLILDLGPADKVDPRVESLGKPFESVKRTAIVI